MNSISRMSAAILFVASTLGCSELAAQNAPIRLLSQPTPPTSATIQYSYECSTTAARFELVIDHDGSPKIGTVYLDNDADMIATDNLNRAFQDFRQFRGVNVECVGEGMSIAFLGSFHTSTPADSPRPGLVSMMWAGGTSKEVWVDVRGR